MSVTLTSDLEAMIQEKVVRGEDPDASEVVRQALQLLIVCGGSGPNSTSV